MNLADIYHINSELTIDILIRTCFVRNSFVHYDFCIDFNNCHHFCLVIGAVKLPIETFPQSQSVNLYSFLMTTNAKTKFLFSSNPLVYILLVHFYIWHVFFVLVTEASKQCNGRVCQGASVQCLSSSVIFNSLHFCSYSRTVEN